VRRFVPGEAIMSGTAQNLDREFWRPPVTNSSAAAVLRQVELCARCNSEFVVGSRFCHVCGAERQPDSPAPAAGLSRYLDIRLIRDALGLNTAALVAFVLGLACAGAALAAGLLYSATTLVDWQAVQVWRIEWLLASAAAFLAGILLKRTS
jgi:hypothetical protein